MMMISSISIVMLMVLLLLVHGTCDGFRLLSKRYHHSSTHISISNDNNGDKIISMKTCKNCKKQYDSIKNDDSCRFHTGIYSGRLNRVNDVDTSDLEYFWSCCGMYNLDEPGCLVQKHASYDDNDSYQYSRLTGKKIKY